MGCEAILMFKLPTTLAPAIPDVVIFVLASFVSLPVILATELLLATIESAAVWPLMALDMLPQLTRSRKYLGTKRAFRDHL